jgi:hypothetical protein
VRFVEAVRFLNFVTHRPGAWNTKTWFRQIMFGGRASTFYRMLQCIDFFSVVQQSVDFHVRQGF